jgi:cytochrome c peroxidase
MIEGGDEPGRVDRTQSAENRTMNKASRRTTLLIGLIACMGLTQETTLAETAQEVRAIITNRVGNIDALKVPASDDLMPQPAEPAFRITPEKKRLGKLLFFDPIRSNSIRPEFGGLRALAQTISCGSCHLGETAGKAGAQVSVGMGGEGRGRIDPITGRFVAQRTMMAGLADVLPTPLDVYDAAGTLAMSGRFDAIDGPGRTAPSMIGFAMNNRLFWGGVAGEPYDPANGAKANANPDNLPTGESLVQLTLMGHRMFGTQQFALQSISAYLELFRRAFPDEAAAAQVSGNPDDLCNDDTVGRAIAAFLRTVITRNTPFDRFCAGDDTALTASQLRGAALFFTPATDGGANCVACHSGPALNKTLGDESGQLVEENFHNLGIGDHPLIALAQQTLGDPTIRDIGRAEATGNSADNFEFKSPTLRQLRDAAPFMHSGEIATLRGVVEYVNAGIPNSPDAAGAGNLSTLFTNPRGPSQTGLGLSDDDVTALVDFLENGLYDPAFVNFDPTSTTETFELNAADLIYDPVLLYFGAQNGRVPSGLQHPQTDALTTTDIFANNPVLALCGFFDLFSGVMMVGPLMLIKLRRRRRTRRIETT